MSREENETKRRQWVEALPAKDRQYVMLLESECDDLRAYRDHLRAALAELQERGVLDCIGDPACRACFRCAASMALHQEQAQGDSETP